MNSSTHEGRRPAPATPLLPLVGALSLLAPASALAAGDPAKGEATFKAQCAMCHAVTPGTNRVGPSLSGVAGRTSASAPRFAYSPAMKKAALTWDARTLDTFLTRPAKLVPGTRMTFAGQPNPATRQNLVAYLFSLK
ncbi:c-type cytochrome [Novosphingobium sp. 1949]|uniref:C-type cytochrome n=1 Tax=Novosphingobium organovorum TaxID=2930092 RepID=A0ABT0BJE3_9SPHN|nr:c-type cytochrome [Novosphingobium organovorum]MCJ2185070.1 c-type cytochrome [Novosphingobium organovorum]